MKKINDGNCVEPNCGLPRHSTENRTYSRCIAHQQEHWIKLNANKRGGEVRDLTAAPAQAPVVEIPEPLAPMQQLLMVNLNTMRAQAYEVIRATPARAVVPDEPRKYVEFLERAEAAGYTVVLEK